MTTTRRTLGAWLLAAGLVLAVIGLVVWNYETKRADEKRLVGQYTAAITGEGIADINPNRTPAIGLFVVAGMGVLCGVILISSTPATSTRSLP